MWNLKTYVYLYIHTIYIYIHTYIYTYIYTHIYMYTYIYMFMDTENRFVIAKSWGVEGLKKLANCFFFLSVNKLRKEKQNGV